MGVWLPALSLIIGSLLSNAVAEAARGASAGIVPQHLERQVRVRVIEARRDLSVRGFDLHFAEPAAGLHPKHFDRTTEWVVSCPSVGRGPARIVATQLGSNRQTQSFGSEVRIESPAGFLKLMGRPYRESIKITALPGRGCEVVNEVSLEKYLDGLVNSEFSAEWGAEAIAAQVVAARTYAVYQIAAARTKPGSRFDLDASVRDQVYDGSLREDYRSSQVIEKTRGWVLVSSRDQKPLKAFYHSTCGGRTELPENVWGHAYSGFRHGVTCPYCSSSPRFNWSLSVSEEELRSTLLRSQGKRAAKTVSGAHLVAARVGARDASGRATQIVTVWQSRQKSAELKISATVLRDAIGPAKLRSTWFDVEMGGRPLASLAPMGSKSAELRFQGRGNGHGVGMCQWGAKVMGQKGHAMAAILKYYYPDATLKKLW